MLGSYAPHKDGEPYTKNFDPEESPSGMLARSGTYNVRSRVVDDDGEIYAGTWSINSNVFVLRLRYDTWKTLNGLSSSRKNGRSVLVCVPLHQSALCRTFLVSCCHHVYSTVIQVFGRSQCCSFLLD